MHQKVHVSHDSPPIHNKTFEPRPFEPPHDKHSIPYPPPNAQTWAYYGSYETYRSFVDTNQYTAAAPGVSSRLYNPQGPLTIGNARMTPVFLTSVNTEAHFKLLVTFSYTNKDYNETVELEPGNLYNVVYLENGDLKKCVGKCTNIWKVNNSETQSYYKIKFDCSVNYSNQTVIIKNDQLRGLSLYTGYEDQSTEIENSRHSFGTTTGVIHEAIITNAVIDINGYIIEGNIIAGEIDGYTIDGIASGTNINGKNIVTINSKTKNGTLTSGKIIYGSFRTGTIDGEVDKNSNLTVGATIKGTIANAIIANSIVEGGKSSDGTIINPTLKSSILYNGTITGNDVVTTGGITRGNITTGGTTTGGTATGGTAVGTIGDLIYHIEDGITNPESGKSLVTTGGVVTGGTIIGGIKQGDVIIGAIVKGGIVTGGVTNNGVTTKGTLIPTQRAKPVLNTTPKQQFQLDLDENGEPKNWNKSAKNPLANRDDWVIGINPATNTVYSNHGIAVMQDIPNNTKTPILNPDTNIKF